MTFGPAKRAAASWPQLPQSASEVGYLREKPTGTCLLSARILAKLQDLVGHGVAVITRYGERLVEETIVLSAIYQEHTFVQAVRIHNSPPSKAPPG